MIDFIGYEERNNLLHLLFDERGLSMYLDISSWFYSFFHNNHGYIFFAWTIMWRQHALDASLVKVRCGVNPPHWSVLDRKSSFIQQNRWISYEASLQDFSVSRGAVTVQRVKAFSVMMIRFVNKKKSGVNQYSDCSWHSVFCLLISLQKILCVF